MGHLLTACFELLVLVVLLWWLRTKSPKKMWYLFKEFIDSALSQLYTRASRNNYQRRCDISSRSLSTLRFRICTQGPLETPVLSNSCFRMLCFHIYAFVSILLHPPYLMGQNPLHASGRLCTFNFSIQHGFMTRLVSFHVLHRNQTLPDI